MVVRKLRGSRQRGVAAVETALVLIPTIALLFGVFEYGRLFMDWNLLNNAAREGCRYALANNTSSTINTSVQNIVTNYMSGQTSSFTNFTVTVTGIHNGVSTPVNNLVPGDLITVSASGTYKFMKIVPFMPMPKTLAVTSSVSMVCEGGT